MKRFLFLSLLFVLATNGVILAQSDTLVTRKKEKIPCKITEISETEIKFRKASYLDGPAYTMDKNKLSMIIYANGEKELVKEDELSVNQTAEIIDRRKAVKFEPFSAIGNKLVFGYEHVLKVGTNLEFKVGYINNTMTTNGVSSRDPYTVGGFLKGGVKFLLGQDYYIKGMKYAHPLKGRYIRIDAVFTSFKQEGITRTFYSNSNPYTLTTLKTDINVVGYGLMLNYGRQFILGNIVTLDYYIGVGYAGTSISYTNPAYSAQFKNTAYGNDINNISNFYAYTKSPSLPITFNAGLTLGIILK